MNKLSWSWTGSMAPIGNKPRLISTRTARQITAGAMHRPLRLTIDGAALQANWRWLQDHAGGPAGAAIKADGYGLGAREALATLYEAGCRTFFVSTWAEAGELGEIPGDCELIVLHGVGPDDVKASLSTLAR